MKKFLIGLGIVLLVLVLVVVAVPFFISGDFVARRVAEAVRESTGRELTFDGPVELSLVPTVALEAENVSLSNADWATAEHFASFDRLDLEVAPFALISGTLDLRRLLLASPQVNLEVAEDGRTNWDDLAGEAAPREPGEPGRIPELRLGDVRILDAGFEYVNRATGQTVVARGGSLTAALDEPDGPLRVDGDIQVNDRPVTVAARVASPQALAEGAPSAASGRLESPVGQISFAFDADPGVGTASGPITLAVPDVNEVARWLDMPEAGPAPIQSVRFDGTLSVAPDQTRLEGFTLQADEMTAAGTVTADTGGRVPAIAADIRLSALDLDTLTAAMGGGGGAGARRAADPPPAETQEIPWSTLQQADLDLDLAVEGLRVQGQEIGPTQVTVDVTDGVLDAALSDTEVLGGTVSATATASSTASPPSFAVDADIQSIQAGPFLVTFGPFSDARIPLDLDLMLDGAGRTQQALLQSLNGTVSLGIDGGSFTLPNPNGPALEASDLVIATDLPGIDGPLTIDGGMTVSGERLDLGLTVAEPPGFLQGEGSPLSLSIEAPRLTAGLDGRASLAPSLSGQATLSVPSVPGLLEWLPMGPAPSAAPVDSVRFAGSVDASPARVAIEGIDAAVDDTTVTGQVSADLADGVPDLLARLDVGVIDLGRLQLATGDGQGGGQAGSPAPEGGGANGGGPGTAGGWSTEPIDLSPLRQANVDAVVDLEGVRSETLTVGPTELTLLLQNGDLRFDAPSLPIFNGQASIDLDLEASAETPSLALNASAQGLQVGPIVAMAGGPGRLTGTAEASATISAQGRSQRELVSTLDGTSSLAVRDGALQGINIAAILRDPVAYALGGAPDVPQETDFAEVGGSFAIDGGRARTDDLRMLAPLFRMTGSGVVDLPPRTLDLTLEPTLVPTPEGQSSEFEQIGLQVPFNVTGSFDNPTVKPDFSRIATNLIQDPQAAQRAVERLRQGGSPEEILGEFLGGAAGGAGNDQGGDGGSAPTSPEEALRQLGEGALRGGDGGDGGDGGNQGTQPTPEDAVREGIRGLFGR